MPHHEMCIRDSHQPGLKVQPGRQLQVAVGGPGKTVAVSYTHLDVYKRQAMTCGAGLLLAVAAILLAFQDFSSTMRNHTQLRYLINPLNSVYALGKDVYKRQEHALRHPEIGWRRENR